MDKDSIEHSTIHTNNINLHVAQIGPSTGAPILFIHGFPELWYSWRHQMLNLASQGYRCMAPDLRGFGDSDAPTNPLHYTVFHVVGDLIGLLDALQIEKAFVVGHDWGALIAWNFCMFRPDRVTALVNSSVVYRPRNPTRKPIETLRALLGEDFYICRFQEPGHAEEVFSRTGTERTMKVFLTSRDTRPPTFPTKGGSVVSPDNPLPLPDWLSEEDLKYYTTKYEKSGFTGGLNYYRNMDLNWELTAPWQDAQIKVPVKFIIGDQDLTYYIPSTKEYIHGDGFKRDVPFLQEVVVLPGVAHFLTQEVPDVVSRHIHDFIKKF